MTPKNWASHVVNPRITTAIFLINIYEQNHHIIYSILYL